MVAVLHRLNRRRPRSNDARGAAKAPAPPIRPAGIAPAPLLPRPSSSSNTCAHEVEPEAPLPVKRARPRCGRNDAAPPGSRGLPGRGADPERCDAPAPSRRRGFVTCTAPLLVNACAAAAAADAADAASASASTPTSSSSSCICSAPAAPALSVAPNSPGASSCRPPSSFRGGRRPTRRPSGVVQHTPTFALLLSLAPLLLLLLLQSPAPAHGAELGHCPNACSGNGWCTHNCTCFGGFIGADCSQRTCPHGYGFVDSQVEGDYEEHYVERHGYVECSHKGTCDRATGECTCFHGFSGASCGRQVCPHHCSGHGVCEFIEDIMHADHRQHLDTQVKDGETERTRGRRRKGKRWREGETQRRRACTCTVCGMFCVVW